MTQNICIKLEEKPAALSFYADDQTSWMNCRNYEGADGLVAVPRLNVHYDNFFFFFFNCSYICVHITNFWGSKGQLVDFT